MIVAQFHWGTLRSNAISIDDAGKATTALATRTLKAGEAHGTGVFLQTLREHMDVPPGRYTIEAMFVYSDLGGWPQPHQDFVARSGVVEIEVGDPQPGDKFRAWRLR